MADGGRDLRRGAALVAVGLWLLLGTMGGPRLDYGESWPLLLVFLGIAFLATPVAGRGRRPGPLLIAWGALCWVAVHQLWGLGWDSIWPLILVAVGASLVWSAVVEERRSSDSPSRGGVDA